MYRRAENYSLRVYHLKRSTKRKTHIEHIYIYIFLSVSFIAFHRNFLGHAKGNYTQSLVVQRSVSILREVILRLTIRDIF